MAVLDNLTATLDVWQGFPGWKPYGHFIIIRALAFGIALVSLTIQIPKSRGTTLLPEKMAQLPILKGKWVTLRSRIFFIRIWWLVRLTAQCKFKIKGAFLIKYVASWKPTALSSESTTSSCALRTASKPPFGATRRNCPMIRVYAVYIYIYIFSLSIYLVCKWRY